MPSAAASQDRSLASGARLIAGGVLLAVLLLSATASTIGQGSGSLVAMLVLTIGEVVHAWPAAVYLLAAFGMGRLASPLWRGAAESAALQLACGIALMLSLSHLMGVVGLLKPAPALAVCAVGVALCVRQVIGGGPKNPSERPARVSWVWLAALPAAAIIVSAVAVPPGSLWSSEARGYDVLSYHLALPQEWIANGRVWPLEHNVYSYLPGYVEAAFAHVAVMGFPPAAEALTAEGGWRLTAPKALHAGLWAVSGWLVSRAAAAWLSRLGVESGAARHASAAGGALVAATPWAVVVGSMAYNEMAVVALGGGAMLACACETLTPGRRGVVVGVLVGVAAGAKPSAALMVAPMAAAALFGLAPLRDWKWLFFGGLIAGTLSVAPWLVRNAIASGNPVFPFATGLLGAGHWSAEQAERWASGHRGTGSIVDHLGLLVMPDASAGASASVTERHRGLSHPQWAVLGLLLLASLGAALTLKSSRRMGAVLLVGALGSLVVWLLLTHHQSRFLVPMLIPAGLGVALACGTVATRRPLAALAAAAVFSAVLAQSAQTWRVWSGENNGVPAAQLGLGSSWARGELLAPERQAELPTSLVRLLQADGAGGLLLVGEATPLYWPSPAEHPTRYATTWDDSILTRAIRSDPGEPEAWVESLRAAGIELVYINASEIDRLRASGWLDPSLTDAAIASLLEQTQVVRGWPGRVLVRLPRAAVEGGERDG